MTHDDRSIQVSWTALTSASDIGGPTLSIDSYALEYSVNSSTSYTEIQGISSNSTLTTATLSGLTPHTTYNFRVKALNIHAFGTDSADLSITTSDDVPEQITVLSTAITSGTYITVSWTAPSDNGLTISAYLIEF